MPPKKSSKSKAKPIYDAVAQSSLQPVFRAPNLEQLYVGTDPACPNSEEHTLGGFCATCRGIPMPWGARLPIVRIDSGEDVTKGPVGSLLDGVELRNETAIAVMTAVATLNASRSPHSTIPGLSQLIVPNGYAAAAGVRVGVLWANLTQVAGPNDIVPSIASIINDALNDPFQTNAEHFARIASVFAEDDPRKGAEFEDGFGTAGSSQPRLLGQRFDSDSEASEMEDDVNDSENDEDSDSLIMISRPTLENLNKSHRPPKEKGKYEFMPGTDISDPVLGLPEPQKFFLCRRLVNDHRVTDLREYPLWRDFDWNDQIQITALKKHRAQVRHRTQGTISTPRPGWTQAEKDALKHQIELAIAYGATKSTINWDAIAAGISRHFKGLVQKKGSKMAECTKLVNGVVVKTGAEKSKVNLLAFDRDGCPPRVGRVIKGACDKYADIKKILNDTKVKKGKGVEEETDEQGEEDVEMEDAEEERSGRDDGPSGGAGGSGGASGASCR